MNSVVTKPVSLHSASIRSPFRLRARSVALNLHPPPRQTFCQLAWRRKPKDWLAPRHPARPNSATAPLRPACRSIPAARFRHSTELKGTTKAPLPFSVALRTASPLSSRWISKRARQLTPPLYAAGQRIKIFLALSTLRSILTCCPAPTCLPLGFARSAFLPSVANIVPYHHRMPFILRPEQCADRLGEKGQDMLNQPDKSTLEKIQKQPELF